MANSACLAQALSTNIQLKGLMKDFRAKNVDLAQLLEMALYYRHALSAERTKVEEAEVKRVKVQSKLDKVKVVVKQLQKELHETEYQVPSLQGDWTTLMSIIAW